MKPIEFPEQTAVVARNQPPYFPFPVFQSPGGNLTGCWKLSWKERIAVLWRGVIWQQILTFGKPLQPQKLSVDTPFIPVKRRH